ncbi:MAG: ATP-binding protein [Coriobacteriia bacterium]|nr:ATP-binding protein [Coriobacteriia bacterium]
MAANTAAQLAQPMPKSEPQAAQVEFPRPLWLRALTREIEGGTSHVFLLHGNVRDEFALTVDGRPALWPIEQYLRNRLPDIQLCVRVSLSRGVELVLPLSSGGLTDLERTVIEGQKIHSPADEEQRDRGPADETEAERVLRDIARETAGENGPASPEEAFRIVDRLLRTREGLLVLVDFVHHLLPDAPGGSVPTDQRMLAECVIRWTSDPAIRTVVEPDGSRRRRQAVVALLAPDLGLLCSELTSKDSGVQTIAVGRPSEEERLSLISTLRDANLFPLSEELDLAQAANITGGMTNRDIRDLGLGAVRRKERMDAATVADRKSSCIAADTDGVLHLMPELVTPEMVGGHRALKADFGTLAERFRAADAESRKRLPQLIVLVGPPGTGKSLNAKSWAYSAAMTYVELGRLLDMWVGQSERRFDYALQVLVDLAPAVLFVDEIEKEFGADAGSSVGNRLQSKLLKFLSSEPVRGKVVVIAATNYPEQLDPALLSRARVYPVLAPTAGDRAEILMAMTAQNGVPLDPQVSVERVAAALAGLSGRDIRQVWDLACDLSSGAPVNEQVLEECIAEYVPSEGWAQRLMTLRAIQACRYLRHLPEVPLPWIGEGVTSHGLARDRDRLEAEIVRAYTATRVEHA